VKKLDLIITPAVSFRDAAVLFAGPTSGAICST
jgi:hypothetical protein